MNTLVFPKDPIKKTHKKSLKYVVQNVMLDMNETGTRNYQRYLQWAIRGVKEIGKYTGVTLRTQLLTADSKGRVYFPEDYVKYTKIGVVVESGSGVAVMILGQDDEMAKMRGTDKCGGSLAEATTAIKAQQEGYFSSSYYFDNFYRNGQFIGGVYGLGGGFAQAYYDIDDEMGYIQLTDTLANENILLEYISTGIGVDGNATVPNSAVETLIAFIKWKYYETKRGTPMNRIRDARMMYVSELKLLKKLESVFTEMEFLDLIRKGQTATPKL